jgi:hypothetical protein
MTPPDPHPPQGTRRYEMQDGPDTRSQTPPQGRPALSGPNSVPTNRTPHPDSGPHPPE